MDLRRWGEFAFGIGVFMCGGAFLLLALERLSAPISTGAPTAPSIVALGSQAPSLTASAASAVPTTPRRTVAAAKATQNALVRRPARAGRPNVARRVLVPTHPTAAPIVAVARVASPARPIAEAPVFERSAPVPQSAKHTGTHPRPRPQAPIAAIHRSDAQRRLTPRLVVANNRSPASERTPEPPIGYEDHPALVRSEGPSAATPTMEPVQVEITTTHLGH